MALNSSQSEGGVNSNCKSAFGSRFVRIAGAILVTLIPFRGSATEDVLPLPIKERTDRIPMVQQVQRPANMESLQFTVVSVLDSVRLSSNGLTFGDTDQDGQEEMVTKRASGPGFWQTWIFEGQADHVYTPYHLTAIEPPFSPYSIGDLDGDGRMEIAGQHGSYIRVYESPTPTSHPSVLAWESPQQTNVTGYPTMGDTDRDGRRELIYSYNFLAGTGRLKIFESTGDNALMEVLSAPLDPGNAWTGVKAICDLDGDGWDEIAMTSDEAIVLIYEASGDNSWSVVWSDSTDMVNSFSVAAGWDVDGNGIPELYVAGEDWTSYPDSITWDTRIYEATGDNQYALRTVIRIPVQLSGHAPAILGDFDGDGDGEYLTWGWDAWVFDAEVGGTWSPIGSFPSLNTFFSHDLNKNGRWDVVIVGESDTPILEADLPTTVLPHDWTIGSLQVSPNPLRAEARITWDPRASSAHRLEVYDVSGRLIEQRRVGGAPFTWSARSLPSGQYFLQIEDASGRPLARGRAMRVGS